MSIISPSAFAPPVASRVAAPQAANDPAAASAPTSLREKVRRLERAHSVQRAGHAAVPTGLPAIDALLPEGGLLTGALHEVEAGAAPSGRVAAHDGAALGFAAHLMGRFAARTPGTLLWCRRPSGVFDAPPYAPALAAWFDPARLLVVTARRDEDVFWAMEEGLRCPGIAAVLGETRAADATAGRRLSLAAEKSGVPALLLRPQPAPPQSVCVTRWRIASAPSRSTPGLHDIGAPRWRLELRRNRFGAPSTAEIPSWLVEWNDETHCLAVVSETLHGSTGARFEESLFEERMVS
ncbi:MAG: damage-inducible mutagenesis protein [Rhodospirillales bacterium]|nr:damage-inducible mutagenesis protein [Rhodospirillales bacterium]